jgi:hypothetical protein
MPTAAEFKAMLTVIKPVKETRAEPVEKKARKQRAKPGEVDPRQMDLVPVKRTMTKRSDYAGNGHWQFEELLAAKAKFGFIYVIRNLTTGRCYIGKKQYRGAYGDNKGVESNWPWYVSSRDTLVEEIKAQGKEGFEFIALEEYTSNKALGYAEVWSLMRAETPSNQKMWYNRLVNKVNWFCVERITDRHKKRLDAIIAGLPLDNVSIQ